MPSVLPASELQASAHDASPSRHWLRHLGMLNDYVRIPYANGSSFASQFFYREFRALGHEVTVVGPSDPDASLEDLPEAPSAHAARIMQALDEEGYEAP